MVACVRGSRACDGRRHLAYDVEARSDTPTRDVETARHSLACVATLSHESTSLARDGGDGAQQGTSRACDVEAQQGTTHVESETH